MSTQNNIDGAIARSISHNETVTVRIGSEESLQDAYDSLIEQSKGYEVDYVDVSPTLREVWGWTDQTPEGQQDWRVHLMQDERTGAARFAE